jgi:hypothetical protein
MIITIKQTIGTVAYDGDAIVKMEFSPNCGIKITYAVSGKGNATPVIQADRFYIPEAEYEQVLEQWKKSKETSK